MEWLRTAQSIAAANDQEKRYLLRETKYAILAATLFLLFSGSWFSSFVVGVFPGAKGPVIMIYKVILIAAIYYIIQKTTWFQEL